MGFENYTQFYCNEPSGTTIRPKESITFSFTVQKKENVLYRLFTVGETEQYYMWKDEPDGPVQYRSVTDSLDSAHALHDRFCLDFSSESPKAYTKRAYRKIMWPPFLSYIQMAAPVPTNWKAGISVIGENVSVEEDGFLQMRIDIRLEKDGVSRHSIEGAPDKSIILPFFRQRGKTYCLHLTFRLPAVKSFSGRDNI